MELIEGWRVGVYIADSSKGWKVSSPGVPQTRGRYPEKIIGGYISLFPSHAWACGTLVASLYKVHGGFRWTSKTILLGIFSSLLARYLPSCLHFLPVSAYSASRAALYRSLLIVNPPRTISIDGGKSLHNLNVSANCAELRVMVLQSTWAISWTANGGVTYVCGRK